MSSSEGRAILLAVDDSDACQLMLQWVLDSDLLLPGDKLHLLHVTMRDTAGSNQLPGGDYFEQAHPHEAQRVVLAMLQRRFLGSLEALGMRPTVHIVQASQCAKTIGRLICAKAQDLNCSHVYLAAGRGQQHHSSRGVLARMLSGPGIKQYVQQHCTVPLTIVAAAGDTAEVAEFEAAAAAAGKPSSGGGTAQGPSAV
uniref:UspA domain-containing protein n=1 Tax=Tetradesmus obliquus TaxID=3088 RepID=A0A383WGV7_TETOB|eukprot:jgi/Sobl393_1/11231/SZX76661.1